MSSAWPSTMPLGARRPGPAPATSASRAVRGPKRRIGQQFEGQRLQRVARQDRRRLVPFHMHRRLAAPQVVVVHAGQVVMDQGIGMQRLDRRRRADRALRRQRPASARLPAPETPRSRLPPRRPHSASHGSPADRRAPPAPRPAAPAPAARPPQNVSKAHSPSAGVVPTALPFLRADQLHLLLGLASASWRNAP